VINHIQEKRMSQYVHMKVELTLEELAHMSGCELCLKLFKVCLASEKSGLTDEEGGAKKESA